MRPWNKPYILILAFSMLGFGLIFLAPLLASAHYETAAILIYLPFSTICHQIPTRSFYLFDHSLPICHRCTGIYLGFLVGILIYPAFKSLRRSGLPDSKFIIIGLILPGLDLALDWFGWRENTVLSRFTTGVVFGFIVSFYIVPAFREATQAFTKKLP